jgi:hypothetical protein
MNGYIIIGLTKIFEIDGWINNGPLHTFTGRLMVYSRKVSKTNSRKFKIFLNGEDIKNSVRLHGMIQKCTSSELQILANDQRS